MKGEFDDNGIGIRVKGRYELSLDMKKLLHNSY